MYIFSVCRFDFHSFIDFDVAGEVVGVILSFFFHSFSSNFSALLMLILLGWLWESALSQVVRYQFLFVSIHFQWFPLYF